MKSGLYALVSLGESRPDRRDCEALGLSEETGIVRAPGIVIRACDEASLAISVCRVDPDTLIAFAGYLDEPEELAVSLGIDGKRCPAELAGLALERFGAEAPQRMTGEWSLLRWSVPMRELTLLGSENTRDPLFWAANGNRVAVSPDCLRLGRLSWVGLALDPEGFALSLGRAATISIRPDSTVWKDIFRVRPATAEVFAPGIRRTIAAAPQRAPSPWSGNFDEAIDALNTLGRRIVGQNLRRYNRSAFLLSGGLDSSVLATWGSQERHTADDIVCLTSVAPDHTGLKDERVFSGAVAEQLSLPTRWVVPHPGVSAFLPCPEGFVYSGQPVPSLRHYLYDALWNTARDEGAGAVFDGAMGEYSITEKNQFAGRTKWLRRAVHAARSLRSDVRRRNGWPVEAFHARFASGMLHDLPQDWRKAWRAGWPRRPHLRPADLRGFHPALLKTTNSGTGTEKGVRHLMPFRDRRLVRFAAGLPFGFGERNGQSRAMARAILRGHVPEWVLLRPRGLPFSPDYETRLAQQAAGAGRRLELWSEAGIGRWLDLEWLNHALSRLAAGANAYRPEQNQAQITTMAAEFLLWCASLGVKL